jgi:hypothetical protein
MRWKIAAGLAGLFLAAAWFVWARANSDYGVYADLEIHAGESDTKLVVVNLMNIKHEASVPLDVDLSVELLRDGKWSPDRTVMRPSPFVLDGREVRDLKYPVTAKAVRANVVVRDSQRRRDIAKAAATNP